MKSLLILIVMALLFLVGPYLLIKYWYKTIRFKMNDYIVWNDRLFIVVSIFRLEGKTKYQLTAIESYMEILVVDSDEIDTNAILKSQHDKIKGKLDGKENG